MRRSEANPTATPRSRPIIGVTGPDRGGLAAWWMTKLALWRVGAQPVRITPSCPHDPAGLDGLVLGGGADVAGGPPGAKEKVRRRNVALYRRALSLLLAPALLVVRLLLSRFVQPAGGKDEARDTLELSLLDYAHTHDLPVLGICRGAQLMNQSQGGTLLWNLSTFYAERPELHTVLPRREVRVAPGSLLASTLGTERCKVNSLHSHAVERPGRKMCIVAREPSGVVQAIEHQGHAFWVGVQWHPEYLPQLPTQQRLFAALTREAARKRVRTYAPTPQSLIEPPHALAAS